MKKLLVTLSTLLLCLWAGIAQAGVVLTAPIFSGVVAASTTYPLNLNTGGVNGTSINKLSLQVDYSSPSLTASTFTDGSPSTGSFQVLSTSIAISKSTDSITVAQPTVTNARPASVYLTVASTNGLTGSSVNIGPYSIVNGIHWTSSNTIHGTCASISTAIGNLPGFIAECPGASGAIIYATTTVKGSFGNAYATTSSTPTALTFSSSTMNGGQDDLLLNALLTINGTKYRQGYHWFEDVNYSSNTAKSIGALWALVGNSTTSVSGSVIYSTATTGGAAGNLNTIDASPASAFTGVPSTATGGQDEAVITIGGVAITNISSDTVGHSATALANAIAANATLNANISASVSGATVTITSKVVGTGTTYTLAVNTSSISVSGAGMTGGTNSSYKINTKLITIPAHGMATSLGVIYSTSSAFALSGLTNQTTYYVAAVDANTVALATTTANATNGIYIVLASSSIAGPHSFSLRPQALTGPLGIVLQGSDDCSHYSNLSVSSVSIPSPYTTGTFLWDLGTVNYRCVQVNYGAGATGNLNLVVTPNAKD